MRIVICAAQIAGLPAFVHAAPMGIIVVLVDDLGWSDLGCYGSDLHETPRIDAFARSAVRFTQGYSAAPVCTPTRAALMTGKHPARLHMTIWYEASNRPPTDRAMIPPVTLGNLPLSEVTLAERLRQAGYATAHFGKWHLGDAAHYPEAQGFDVNVGGTFWGAPATHFFPYRGLFGAAKELRYVPGLAQGEPEEYLADRLTSEAIDWLKSVQEGPFFLSLCHYSVHTPVEAPRDLVESYEGRITDASKHRNATYAAMVGNLDTNVGRLLDAVDELGLSDQTLVILTSDNGGYINAYDGTAVTTNTPLRSGKGSLYEGGVRVPLLVRWPGVSRPGLTSSTPAVTMDLVPTILDAAEVPLADSDRAAFDGVSLVNVLAGEVEPELADRPLYFHYPHYYPTTTPVGAVREGVWKLLEYFEDGRLELYRLDEDPSERENLAEKEAVVADRLQARLASWRETMNAQMPRAADAPEAKTSARE